MNTTINTPLELLFDQLRDIYSMEIQISESMPHLVSLCSNEELRDLIVIHSRQNGNQIAEISAIFASHGESPGDDKCKAMAGLIEGGTAHLKGATAPPTRNLMMIAHCLRIEYYEMAAYEFTTLLSGRLGLMQESEILSELRAEEMDMAAALMVLEPDLFETANSQANGSSSHNNGLSIVLDSLQTRGRENRPLTRLERLELLLTNLFLKPEPTYHGPEPRSLSQ